MKEKISIGGGDYFQEALTLGCWAPARRRKRFTLKSIFRRYQKEIDLLLATAAIGLMFLVGIWTFLVELSSLCFH